MWSTVLGRTSDYEDATPKQLFGQLEAHKRFNNPDSEKESNQEVGKTFIDNLL